MKSFILPLIVLLTLAGFASTVKKQTPVKAYSKELTGEWGGQYTIEGGPFVNPLVFEFGPDHRLQVSDGPKEWGDKATGTYYVSGDTLTAKYRFKEGIQDMIVISALVKDNRIEGTWQWVKGKGKMLLLKKGTTIHQQETTVR